MCETGSELMKCISTANHPNAVVKSNLNECLATNGIMLLVSVSVYLCTAFYSYEGTSYIRIIIHPLLQSDICVRLRRHPCLTMS
jgi:hypothetical protein